jgi:acetyl-CoA synthetase
LAPFSRVLMVLDDTPVYPAAFFGALKAGLVPVLINTLSPADLLGYYLRDSQAEIAIVESGLCRRLGAETLRDSRLKLLVAANGPAADGLPVPATAWSEWIGERPASLQPADTGRDDMAFWMYSTGSTGRPKGIVHLHHDMAYTQAAYGERVLGIRESDICYSPPKIFFAYGLGNSMTFPFSVGASSVLCPGRPEPEAVFGCIERFRPTLWFGLPTLYNALINHPRADAAELSSLRLCLSAAETLSAELFGAWRDRFGFEIVEGLGSTEMLHIYLSNRPDDRRPGSAGRRVPGYELSLRGDDAQPVAAGEPGILWVRGGSSAPCYWNQPDKTAQTMRDDWIHTGDRFRLDADGFHYFLGRADDLIKVSGQWVYPQEIEQCLADHPAVRECAVMGVAMADGRMTTKAFVVVAEGRVADEALSRGLREFVKGRLLPYKYPRIIVYLARLPKTGTGKIDRQTLLDGEPA